MRHIRPIRTTLATGGRGARAVIGYFSVIALLGTAMAVVVAPSPAGAQTEVATEAELRVVFGLPAPGVIELTADITLEGRISDDGELCELGSLTNAPESAVTVTSSADAPAGGWTITQTCEDARIFTMEPFAGETAALTIDHVTLTGGNLTIGPEGEPAASGGAMFSDGGDVVITGGSTLTGNTAWAGGAISVSGGGGVTVTDSTLAGNTARGGGAISVSGGGGVTVDGASSLDGNEANHSGAAIHVSEGGHVTVGGASTLAGNDAGTFGGAIFVSGGGDVTVGGASTLTDNTARIDTGGAIHVFGGGDVTVTDSTLAGNTARRGGAILGFGNVSVINSTLTGNTARSGGGAISSLGEISVINSTISDNEADRGGAIVASGEVTLLHATVVDNRADIGANIDLDEDGTLRSFGSVVALPGIDGENCSLAEGAAFESDGFNLSDDASCGLDDESDLSSDPQLGSLADNGGPTPTRLPEPGSPLIDAIPLSDCAPAVASDQRGVARPQGFGCDIGAVEVESDVVLPVDAQVAVTTDPDDEVTEGEDFTFIAEVEPVDEDVPVAPTGTVEFFAGDESLGTAELASPAVLTVSDLDEGEHSITAHYQGDGVFAPATAEATVVTVTAVEDPVEDDPPTESEDPDAESETEEETPAGPQTVARPAPSPSPGSVAGSTGTGTTAGSLATTGTDSTTTLVAAALGLLVIGVFLRSGGRRRRSTVVGGRSHA